MTSLLMRFAGIAPALTPARTAVDTTLRGGMRFLVRVLHASFGASKVEMGDLLLGFGTACAGFLSVGRHALPFPICPHQLQPVQRGASSFTAFAIMLPAPFRAEV
jgi:hypothetical protein